MAGTPPAAFNSAAFRTAIRNTMTMALPGSVPEQITFRTTEQTTFTVQDPAAHPYSWTETPKTDVPQNDVHVPAAIEWAFGTDADNAIGNFDTSKAVITLLDVDYALVKTCNEVVINDRTYIIEATAPPIGLFDVTVYQLHISSRG